MQNKTLELLYVSCWHFHEIFSKRTNLSFNTNATIDIAEPIRVKKFRRKEIVLGSETVSGCIFNESWVVCLFYIIPTPMYKLV